MENKVVKKFPKIKGKMPRKGKKKRLRKNEGVLRELQETMKCNNIHIIEIQEGKEEEQGIQNLFEKVMMENFPNLLREKVTQIQESQRVPSKRNSNRPTARPTTIKMAKFQDRENLKGSKAETGSNIQGSPDRPAADVSIETLQARRDWQ